MTNTPPRSNGTDSSDAFAMFKPSAMMFNGASMLNNPAMDSLARVGENWTKACLAWQEELTHFTTARFQRDSEAVQAMMGCKSWGDIVKLQQAWATATVQACMDQAGHFTQLATKLAPDMTAFSGAARPAPVPPAPVTRETHHRTA